ncbi:MULTISPECIES: lanthionine synthetase C family protein [unclassified Streptomyces]|uniref:lanthionine synthetase C family protein n=1 Tax=unclassified Streptomyces TaxID=2593676 RepID=UPI002DDAFDB8|nr:MULTISPECIES: lanthionine synthetase C family protein [unclassified Streptomyces]WSA91651.1 lanthionine synthetase C family protein [Streptomyces sp. NBC_01795]WSB76023.1 lanthionine synthetase C family protein [Streptomyces sp. NBC_01775]WSS15703.1 lanthionine synthetase C family protein [Streptomyces sp. NBC_01186]WSS44543.1 lanthionine synthetase C family protein [Streptomyces sp. NBC_01187]
MNTALAPSAHSLIQEFTDHLAQPAPVTLNEPWAGQSLAEGAVGVALVHVEQAARQAASWHAAHRWITQGAAGEISAADTTGLFLGAPALAFVLHTVPHDRQARYAVARKVLHRHVTALAHRRTSAALARIRRGGLPDFAEYDTLFGLTGLGAYLLRTAPDSNAFERVLSYLVELTHPLEVDGIQRPGWWVGHDPHRRHSAAFRAGHGNLGAAHGITGPLLLLAQALRRGVSVKGQAEAIRTICDHLHAWRQDSEAGPWWPEHLTVADVAAGRTHHRAPGRPSWCYGTPGIARAGQLAGIALQDQALQRAYEEALLGCLSDRAQLALVSDTSLCHGWAGIYQTTYRAVYDALTPELAAVLPALEHTLLAQARPGVPQGPGFLTGDAGCALALTTLAADPAPTTGWDACLLIV